LLNLGKSSDDHFKAKTIPGKACYFHAACTGNGGWENAPHSLVERQGPGKVKKRRPTAEPEAKASSATDIGGKSLLEVS
jgi:hypothetical protein